MMYVPLQTEIVECPSALGADVSGGAIGCGDGSIFIQPWPNDQLLAHSNDGNYGRVSSVDRVHECLQYTTPNWACA